MTAQAIIDFAAQTTDPRELLCAASEHVISYIEDNFESDEMTQIDEIRAMIEQLINDIIVEAIDTDDDDRRLEMIVDIRCTLEACDEILDDIDASDEFREIVSETFYMIAQAARIND